MGERNNKNNTPSRKFLLGVLVFAVAISIFAITLASDIVMQAPTSQFEVPQRPGIVNIPTVFTTVQDSEGNFRNISTSVALDLEENQVGNYNIDDLRSIVTHAMLQVDGDSLESLYDTDFVVELIRSELVGHVNPDHLIGIHITGMDSGINPIAREISAPNERPTGPTWNMRR
ncbi:MAG: hypothetical protein FWD96_03810 [Defluviitaleaceae bacterium]|nr:hypothetical protein [Defluviitaleaceae bacterium]